MRVLLLLLLFLASCVFAQTLPLNDTQAGAPDFTATSSPAAAIPVATIPDNAYDGSLASMLCDVVDASAIAAGSTVDSVDIQAAISHTYIGDLVIKLVSPDGSTLGVMSRPGSDEPADDGQFGPGSDSSNLAATSPVRFFDGAPYDAESMGSTIDDASVVCQDDGLCNFFANPGAVATPPINFAGFVGETASGNWTLCIGDAENQDVGELQTWTLNISYSPPSDFTATSSPAAVIPDNAYDGSLASMRCDAIDASAIPAGSTVDSVDIQTAINHTFIGDLVIKLVSPVGSTLGVMSRPGIVESADDGQFGLGSDSSNLAATSPVRFLDGASADADSMGSTIGDASVVCQDDGLCDYFANPGAVATPPNNFAGFVGEPAPGNWTLCIGDAENQDVGELQSWTLNINYTSVTVPAAPTIGTASAGNAEATVTWTAPVDDGGSAITGYTVTGAPGGSCSFAGNVTACAITGLTNGTDYTFTVIATNAVGNSQPSAPSNTVTPVTVPAAPTSVDATAGNAEATVTWTAPIDDGGSAITGYTVTGAPGGSCSVAGNVTSCAITGLTNGTDYTFTVIATNAVGNSQPSAPSNVVFPGAPDFTETSSPAAAIPDNAYDGSLASMLCDVVDASAIAAGSTVDSVDIQAAINHTFIGDLVIKLVSPDGSTLGVMSRPGSDEPADDGQISPGSDSSNLAATSPVRFFDGAPYDAELMGSTIDDASVVCQDDGLCNFFANPGPIATPPINFAGFVGETAPGDWTLCIGDAESQDVGELQAWTLNINYTTPPDFTATSTPAAVIPSGDYDGSLASMRCDAIDASAIPAGSTVDSVDIQTAINHTWVGDLVIKLVSPVGSTLGVMSRPGFVESVDDGQIGLGSDSSNLAATSPVRFFDGAPYDAESMGSTISNASIVCQDDGLCDYFANPGAVATPPINFAGFVDETAPGNWTLCIGDAEAPDGGDLQSWTLNINYTSVTVPAAPTIGTASAGNAEATVTWAAPIDDGGSAITGYTVTGTPGGSCSVAGNVTACAITGLGNGTDYTFTVIATNAVGNSLPSAPSNNVTPVTVPDAPTSVDATAGNAEATVTWTAPIDDGGSAITGYTVTGTPGGSCSVAGNVTACAITGLSNGTDYTFTVIATNAVGSSLPSAPSNTVTPVTVPAAPTIGTASAGNAEATVTWTAPIDDGGSAITGYTVTGAPGGSCSVAGNVTACAITGLSNGTDYTFTVIATNAEGNSLPSAPSNTVTPATVPAAPTSVNASAGNAEATVTWTAPIDDGGSAITGYTVTGTPGGSCSVAGNATACTITGLSNGTEYTFTVIATNAEGNSLPSVPSNAVAPSQLLFQDRFEAD